MTAWKLSKSVLFVLLLIGVVPGVVGCKDNAEKITEFCTEWKSIADSSSDDCDAMGEGLHDLLDRYEDVHLYGRVDDEASQEAVAPCRDAAESMLKCASNSAVRDAIKRFDE